MDKKRILRRGIAMLLSGILLHEPTLIYVARLSASSNDSIPVIVAVPPDIAVLTLGALTTSPSYTIYILLPILADVAS